MIAALLESSDDDEDTGGVRYATGLQPDGHHLLRQQQQQQQHAAGHTGRQTSTTSSTSSAPSNTNTAVDAHVLVPPVIQSSSKPLMRPLGGPSRGAHSGRSAAQHDAAVPQVGTVPPVLPTAAATASCKGTMEQAVAAVAAAVASVQHHSRQQQPQQHTNSDALHQPLDGAGLHQDKQQDAPGHRQALTQRAPVVQRDARVVASGNDGDDVGVAADDDHYKPAQSGSHEGLTWQQRQLQQQQATQSTASQQTSPASRHVPSVLVPCKFWLRGACQRGNACWYMHGDPTPWPAATAKPRCCCC